MQLKKIINLLEAKIYNGQDKMEAVVDSACGCDLMSDVLCFAKEDIILLTGLNNPHVIRTAEMAGINYVSFVRGKEPSRDLLDLANELNITVLSTKLPLYEACGRLYVAGLGRAEMGERL